MCSRRFLGGGEGKGFEDAVGHVVGSVDDGVVGELEDEVAVHRQAVDSFAVDAHLCAGAMPAIAQGLDDQSGAGESKIDADQPVAAPTEDLLGNGSR